MVARPLDRFASSCAWFREQLKRNGVRLHNDSRLARALDRLEAFRRDIVVNDHMRFDSADEAYDFAAEIYGTDFLTKAIHWGHASGFRLPESRWQLLAKSDPLITRSASTSTRARNQTWETVIASLTATFTTDLAFGDPEPDVTCRYDGRRYAVSAKVVYSRDNVIDNVEKGFKQARTKADAVLVFLDVVSIYPHVDTLRWSQARNFKHNDEAVIVMTDSVKRWCDGWPLEDLARRLRTAATEPVGVAFFLPMYLHFAGAPRPFLYTHLPLTWGIEGPDYAFARAFLHACNVVADFVSSAAAPT
jgi:hypothetical protein